MNESNPKLADASPRRFSRRKFLQRTVLAGGAVLYVYANGHYRISLAGNRADADAVDYKLRILHTNDHHARIEPATVTLSSTAPGAQRDFGGVARRKTLIDDLKATAAPDENVLLVDAGDVFQGTLYFNQYSGAADLEFYNTIGYEVMTIGNHEFDKGQQPLVDFIAGANFPILSANVIADPSSVLASAKSATDVADGAAHKWGKRVIITKGTKKIGLFGLTPPDTGILSNTGPGVTFGTDLAVIAQAQIDALKTDGADIVVGLTHIGYDVDMDLASKVRGMSIIVGGHSHTPLLPTVNPPSPVGVTSAGPYPTLVNDLDGKPVVIVTDWEWGKWLGDITFGFDSVAGTLSVISGVIRPVWAGNITTTQTPPAARSLLPGEGAEITPNAAIQNRIDTFYKPPIAQLQATKIGVTDVLLDGERPNVRNRETNLGDLICDALLAKTKSDGAQIAITNGGGIRASIPKGDVTVGSVLTVLPFGNTIALTTITGAQVIAALENGVSQVNIANPTSSAGRFPQVGGLRFWWMPGKPVGSRIWRVEVLGTNGYAPIDLAASYRVVTNNFMLTGGDGYSVFTQGSAKIDTGYIMADVVQDYITGKSPVNQTNGGRILSSHLFFPWMARETAPAINAATELVRW